MLIVYINLTFNLLINIKCLHFMFISNIKNGYENYS